MDPDQAVRKQLLDLLNGGNAHMDVDEAIAYFPESMMDAKFPNGTYSAWALLEHIRRAQWDILDFIRNPDYKEMDWPDDYWPKPSEKATKKEWGKTIAGIIKGRKELESIIKDPKINLHTKIPWGDGQTVMREILVVSDHNAYHIGEFAIMRQVMST